LWNFVYMSQELNETIDTNTIIITIIYNTRSAYKYPIYIASISHPHLEHINDIHQVCYTHNWYNWPIPKYVWSSHGTLDLREYVQSNLIVKNECRLCNLFRPSFYNQSYSFFFFLGITTDLIRAQNRPSWRGGLYVPRIQAKFDVGGPHIIVFFLSNLSVDSGALIQLVKMEGSDFRGLEFGVNQQRKVRNSSIAQLWKQIIVRYKPSATNIDKDSSECAANSGGNVRLHARKSTSGCVLISKDGLVQQLQARLVKGWTKTETDKLTATVRDVQWQWIEGSLLETAAGNKNTAKEGGDRRNM